MSVARNVVFCKETEKAYLVKFVSNEKTLWVPKQYMTIIEKHINNFTGRETYKVDIPDWLFNKTQKQEL